MRENAARRRALPHRPTHRAASGGTAHQVVHDPPRSDARFVFFHAGLAPTYRRLGELYEEKGDRAKAASYYQKFIDLWRDADADLQPQVAEVKKKLAKVVGEQ